MQGKGLYKDMTAIDNRGIASEWHTPRFFNAREKAMSREMLCDANGLSLDGCWDSYQRRFGHWGKDWDEQITISHFEQARFLCMAREHDARQPLLHTRRAC